MIDVYQIGAMGLNSNKLKLQLKEVITSFRTSFIRELHNKAKSHLECLADEMKQISNIVNKSPDSIDNLVNIMKEIKKIRKFELDMVDKIRPVLQMYELLDKQPDCEEIPQVEQDVRNNIESEWKKLLKEASEKYDELRDCQSLKKSELIVGCNKFKKDISIFKKAYDSEGPNVEGITPKEAAERLRRFKEEFDVHNRTYEILKRGEKLFGVPHDDNEDLNQVKSEINKLSRL